MSETDIPTQLTDAQIEGLELAVSKALMDYCRAEDLTPSGLEIVGVLSCCILSLVRENKCHPGAAALMLNNAVKQIIAAYGPRKEN